MNVENLSFPSLVMIDAVVQNTGGSRNSGFPDYNIWHNRGINGTYRILSIQCLSQQERKYKVRKTCDDCTSESSPAKYEYENENNVYLSVMYN